MKYSKQAVKNGKGLQRMKGYLAGGEKVQKSTATYDDGANRAAFPDVKKRMKSNGINVVKGS